METEDILVKRGMRAVHAVLNRQTIKDIQAILAPVLAHMEQYPPESEWYAQEGMTGYLISQELPVEDAKRLHWLLKQEPQEV